MVDIDLTSIQIPKGNGQSSYGISTAMAQSSQRLFENGILQRTSVQHSFELLYVITGYCTLYRELALVRYKISNKKLIRQLVAQ